MISSPEMIAILSGVVVAGFVWFSWSLIQNINYTLNKLDAKRKTEAEAEEGNE